LLVLLYRRVAVAEAPIHTRVRVQVVDGDIPSVADQGVDGDVEGHQAGPGDDGVVFPRGVLAAVVHPARDGPLVVHGVDVGEPGHAVAPVLHGHVTDPDLRTPDTRPARDLGALDVPQLDRIGEVVGFPGF